MILCSAWSCGRKGFANRCDEDSDVLLEDEATKIIINTKGPVGDIGEDLKAVMHYLDSGAASTDYTKALDAEVESVKSDEKVRMRYMLLVEAYARERSMGKYINQVSLIKRALGRFSVKQMSDLFDVRERDCAAVIDCIEAHPDWDDERIAEEIDWED